MVRVIRCPMVFFPPKEGLPEGSDASRNHGPP